MTILITGSRGKIATPLAAQLMPQDYTAPPPDAALSSSGQQPALLLATRNPSLDPNPRVPTARLDWHDPASYQLPFAHPAVRANPIDCVFLVGDPALYQPSGSLLAFVQFARAKGVRRFVLVSAWEVAEGQACLMGPAHAALRRMEGEGVEWAVLRPQFFMENFAETYTRASIRDENRIYSAADEGRVSFVSADDIAAVARRALIDDEPHNTDHIITGGEALTYDEVAQIFSEVLGRKIEHVKLNQKEFENMLSRSAHMAPDMVKYMVNLDDDIACGRGSHTTDVVERLLGRKPKTMREFVVEKQNLWK